MFRILRGGLRSTFGSIRSYHRDRCHARKDILLRRKHGSRISPLFMPGSPK